MYRLLSVASLFIAAGLTSTGDALAQTFPSRPIHLVVPFPPGGGLDGIARPFSEKLSTLIGQPVIIENRPGAGGNIGTESVVRAAPDGYTLLINSENLATNPLLYKSISYDSIKDLAPIAILATIPNAIAIHPAVPARNLAELIALSKQKPLTFGTPGMGSPHHLIGEMMNLDGYMRLAHVPYKGASLAVADAIGAHIEIAITSLSTVAPHIRAGRLRGIAVLSGTRVSSMPDMPSIVDLGGVAYQSAPWYGFFAPAGTPRAVIQRLNEASVQALVQPDLIERLRSTGYEPGSSTPEAQTAQLESDMKKWQRVITGAKIPKQ